MWPTLALNGLNKSNLINIHSSFYQILLVLDQMKIPISKSEAVVQRCSVKKEFLKISQNSQENTSVRDSF